MRKIAFLCDAAIQDDTIKGLVESSAEADAAPERHSSI